MNPLFRRPRWARPLENRVVTYRRVGTWNAGGSSAVTNSGPIEVNASVPDRGQGATVIRCNQQRPH